MKRKLLSLLVLLLMVATGAWATTYQKVTTLTSGKSYIVVAGGYAIKAESSGSGWVKKTDVSGNISGEGGNVLTTTDTDIVWEMTSSGTGDDQVWTFKNGDNWLLNIEGQYTYTEMSVGTSTSETATNQFKISGHYIYSTKATDKRLYCMEAGFRMFYYPEAAITSYFEFYEEVTPVIKTIYCKMEHGWWTADGAAIGIYTWDEGGNQKAAWPGERMTLVDGETNVWKFDLDVATYKMCIFTRVNGSGAIADWRAKTTDLTIPTDDNDMFTITNNQAVWGDPGCDGTWSIYNKFRLVGSMTSWSPTIYSKTDSYTFKNLAAGNHQFKVVDGESWKGLSDMTEVAAGLYCDEDGNVCFTLGEAGDVTVNYKSGELYTAEGNFVAPEVKLIGINGWTEATDAIALTPAADKKSASLTMTLTNDWYDFKVIRAGDWLGKVNEGDGNYKIKSDWNWVDGLVRDYEGLKAISLQPNAVNKKYTFTWEYATGKLTVTFPTTATVTTAPTAVDGVIEDTNVAIINAGETSDGTLQYAVNKSDSEAPTDGWNADVPTAQGLSAGNVYVWYKVIGNDTHIDSTPLNIAVTIAPVPPTNAVAIDDGNVDAANWEVPTEQQAGQKVTLKYNGKKKVKSITIENPFDKVTAADLGKIIGANGNIYANAAAAEADGTTAVALIAYVGAPGTADACSTAYRGLALALTDATTAVWDLQYTETCLGTQYDTEMTAITDMAGIANTDALYNHGGTHTHTAAKVAREYNGGVHPFGTSEWFLPSAGQWEKMISAYGLTNLKTDANGFTGLSHDHWSSTEYSKDNAWDYRFDSGIWGNYAKNYADAVRACFAF